MLSFFSFKNSINKKYCELHRLTTPVLSARTSRGKFFCEDHLLLSLYLQTTRKKTVIQYWPAYWPPHSDGLTIRSLLLGLSFLQDLKDRMADTYDLITSEMAPINTA